MKLKLHSDKTHLRAASSDGICHFSLLFNLHWIKSLWYSRLHCASSQKFGCMLERLFLTYISSQMR